MTPNRSLIQLLLVLASRMEESGGPKDSVKAIRLFAENRVARRSEHSDYDDNRRVAEERRIGRQRTLFGMLPSSDHTDRLRDAMKQRLYDLMWDGDALGADAIAEFLPSADADEAFAAWEHDIDGKQPLSAYHGRTG